MCQNTVTSTLHFPLLLNTTQASMRISLFWTIWWKSVDCLVAKRRTLRLTIPSNSQQKCWSSRSIPPFHHRPPLPALLIMAGWLASVMAPLDCKYHVELPEISASLLGWHDEIRRKYRIDDERLSLTLSISSSKGNHYTNVYPLIKIRTDPHPPLTLSLFWCRTSFPSSLYGFLFVYTINLYM